MLVHHQHNLVGHLDTYSRVSLLVWISVLGRLDMKKYIVFFLLFSLPIYPIHSLETGF